MSLDNDPFDLGTTGTGEIIKPQSTATDDDVDSLGRLMVFDKTSVDPASTVPDFDPNEIALIDMQTQQMDEYLIQELERAHQLRQVKDVETRVADGTVSRETVSLFEQAFPGVTEALGGLGAFTVQPSRIGLECFRKALEQKRSELAIQTAQLVTEDASGAQLSQDVPLFGYLNELDDRVVRATDTLNKTHDLKALPPLEGNDRYMLSNGAGYLRNANLETMDRQLVLVFAGTDTDNIISDVAGIIEFFDPEKEDIRGELGLSELTMASLHELLTSGRLIQYLASLHAKLGMLIADIRPVTEHYLSVERPEYRDSTVLVKIIEPVREYCRLAKRYIRMCHKLQKLEAYVRRILEKRQQYTQQA